MYYSWLSTQPLSPAVFSCPSSGFWRSVLCLLHQWPFLQFNARCLKGNETKKSKPAWLLMVLQKDQFLVYAQENGSAVLAIVLLGSTVALAYNFTHNMLLQRTSSVAVRACNP